MIPTAAAAAATRNVLFATLCLILGFVVESLSLKPFVTSSPPPPPKFATSFPLNQKLQHLLSPLFGLRGGGEVGSVEDHHQEEKPNNNLIMSALDASSLTGAFVAFGKFYSSSLESAPILTKSVTAAVLFFISDQLAQSLEIRRQRKREEAASASSSQPILAVTSKQRSIYSGLVGFLYFGPTAHYWYAWIFSRFPGSTMISILQKAALGQFFFAPPLFCVFFASALLQNGQFTFANWIQKIRKDLIKGWLGGIGFWPLVNYISYGYVPQKYIPLFVNLMGIIFNIYVSIIANLKQPAEPRAAAKANKSS